MSGLYDILESYVVGGGAKAGAVAGAVGLVGRGDRVEVAVAGSAVAAGAVPMARDSIFRIASITKPMTAAAAMILVDDGRIALDDPVGRWLPELASPMVLRTPGAPLDDVVPAARPITLLDLLTSRCGHGFPSTGFSLPQIQALVEDGQQKYGRDPQFVSPPDEWMAALSRIPLRAQPGEEWLYNTSSDILGVLIARVSGRSFPDFLGERVFEPLGMADTGFHVPAGELDRFTGYYRTGPDGDLELVDAPDGQWSRPPAFPSGAGGLVSTLDDWHRFGRMLLAEGTLDGRRILSAEAVRQMTTDRLTVDQREAGRLFLEGQGWGFGGTVDIQAIDPWNVPGRYGWVGGTGTAAQIVPSTGSIAILLSQLEAGPALPPLARAFLQYAADA